MPFNTKQKSWRDYLFSIEPIDFYMTQIAVIFSLIICAGLIITVHKLDERLTKIEIMNDIFGKMQHLKEFSNSCVANKTNRTNIINITKHITINDVH